MKFWLEHEFIAIFFLNPNLYSLIRYFSSNTSNWFNLPNLLRSHRSAICLFEFAIGVHSQWITGNSGITQLPSLPFAGFHLSSYSDSSFTVHIQPIASYSTTTKKKSSARTHIYKLSDIIQRANMQSFGNPKSLSVTFNQLVNAYLPRAASSQFRQSTVKCRDSRSLTYLNSRVARGQHFHQVHWYAKQSALR